MAKQRGRKWQCVKAALPDYHCLFASTEGLPLTTTALLVGVSCSCIRPNTDTPGILHTQAYASVRSYLTALAA